MGTFNVKSSTLNSNYEYKNDAIIVTGNFVRDATSDQFQNISGSCYRKNTEGEQGDYIGNFNGYMRNGEMKYSTSEMTRQDSDKVWTAIGEIEQYIIGPNQENKEMSQ